MTENIDNVSYFDTRLEFDKKRHTLWTTLWDSYFKNAFKGADSFLELGAGWCDFINTATARNRIAVDLWPGVVNAAQTGVQAHVGSVLDLSFVGSHSIDVAFASNLVEHLHRDEFHKMLEECARVLRDGGRLALLQPNYRYCANRYFDDFTHVSIWSDVSLADYLTSEGWQVETVRPKFMPLTVKSKLPVTRWMIKLYLKFPIKPFAGQMLVVAKRPK